MATSAAPLMTSSSSVSVLKKRESAVAPAIAGLLSGWIGIVIELYRGIAPPLLTVGFVQAANFTMLERGKVRLKEQLGMAFLPSVFFSALGTGMLLSVFTAPFTFCKVQQQVSTNKSLLHCAREAYNLNGIRTFYRGYFTLLCCESFGRGVYMYSYELGRRVDPGSLSVQVASAAWAGIFSWAVIYPLDVVKNRVQLDSSGLKYTNALDCIRKTYREGGIPIFFRGLSMTVIRAAPVAVAILTSYEYIKTYINGIV